MNINEFTALIKALFRNEKGKPYPIDNYMVTEIFNIFNKSGVSIVESRSVTNIYNAVKQTNVSISCALGWKYVQRRICLLLEQLDQKGFCCSAL